MSNDLGRWYQFALQQLAAESYLDRVASEGRDIRLVLEEGNTDTRRTVDGIPDGYSRMPAAQSSEFVNKYTIAAHHANDSTGFSGTLLRWINEQSETEYTLSIRSTEFKPFNKGGDRERDGLLGADGEVAVNGFALGQLAALEDFYQREVLPLVGARKINVTGYSLGGHLATVFTEIHAEAVKAAYVFNSAGRGLFVSGDTNAARIRDMIVYFRAIVTGAPDGHLIEGSSESGSALYRSALAAYVADPNWNPFLPSDANAYLDPRYRWALAVSQEFAGFETAAAPRKAGLGTAGDALITSIYGSALKNDSTLVANSQIHASSRRAVYIEGQPLIEGLPNEEKFDFGNTHAITLVVDSLALMREFQRLDPGLSQAQIELMIAASSARKARVIAGLSDGNAAEGDSLEKALVALRLAFDPGATEVPSDAKPGGFGDVANRQKYFEDLAKLPQEGAYRIEVLADKSASEIALLATRTDDTGIAVRYALRELNPFAVVGGNYGSSRFPNGEIDLDRSSTGRGVTDKWIEARSRLLETLARYNAADGDLTVAQIGGFFQDQEHHIILGSADPNRARIIFASDSNDRALIGFNRDDLIFGGANGEAITVNAGNDYVEGGGGADVIDGGPGSDELRGGAGDDQLSGGLDADKLYGGAGFDTYVYATRDGQDEIVDSDGSGQIVYNGRVLSGGSRTDGFKYTDAQGVKYELVGGGSGPRTLVIDGKLTVRNFSSGNLGIALQDESPSGRPQVVPTRTYAQLGPEFGMFVPYPTDRPADGASTDAYLLHNFVNIYGSDANDTFTYTNHPFGIPGFYGRGGDDEINIAGAVGDATINGGAGSDVIDASASSLLAGSAAPATLVGGGGDDFILGGAADETIWGDNYRVQNGFSRFPNAPGSSSSSSYLIDDFVANLRDGFSNYFLNEDAATLDILAHAGAYIYQEGPHQSISGSRLPEYLIIYDGTDGLLRYLQLEGWTNLGDLSAAVDYVLGADATFDDYIDGGAGNDTINAGSGSDHVLGGAGDDIIDGDRNAAVDLPGALASRFGEPGDDVIDGGDGNDILSDLLGGNDTFIGGAGDDVINSDERVWALDPTKTAFNYVDGGDGNDQVFVRNGTRDGYDVVDGGAGNDSLVVVSRGAGTILGGDGNDSINASSIDGTPSTGVFDVDGGAGDDFYDVTNGVIRDPSGDDTLAVFLTSPDSLDPLFDGVALGLVPLPADLTLDETVTRSGDDLVLRLALASAAQSGTASLTIADWFAGEARPIEHLLTSDGEMSPQQLETWGSFAIGSAASEVFSGGEYRDRILAGGGNDIAATGDGDDLIAGGAGDDVLDGGDGNDTYYYSRGDGNDLITDASGDDRLVFGQGIGDTDVAITAIGPSSVFLSVAGGTIELRGASGRLAVEKLVFADGHEAALSGMLGTTAAVNGSAESDILVGNAAANVISGGAGDDLLAGGAGDDTYVFNMGDGVDRIDDLPSAGERNTIRFGPGISSGMLSLGKGSLEIRVGSRGDAIHLDNVDPSDLHGAHDVDRFEFDDGTSLTYEELLSRGLDLYGGDLEDLIVGSDLADRVRGNGGDDFLVDGAGNDVYFFGRGDGADTLIDQGTSADTDTLVLADDISVSDVSVRASGDDLVIELNNDGGSVTVREGMQRDVVEKVQFADGRSWTAPMLREMAASSNQPPSPPAAPPDGSSRALPQQESAPSTQAEAPMPVADAAPSPVSSNTQASSRLPNGAADSPGPPDPAESGPRRVGMPLDPHFREMQQRLDVLLQTGRTNLGERYADAVREFEERRLQREEAPQPPQPADDEIEAWNTAMHAWHDRNAGFGETDLGPADGGWTMGWGLPASAQPEAGTGIGLPGLANPGALLRLHGAGPEPSLREGLRDLR